MDRFLAQVEVHHRRLQLVALASITIAGTLCENVQLMPARARVACARIDARPCPCLTASFLQQNTKRPRTASPPPNDWFAKRMALLM